MSNSLGGMYEYENYISPSGVDNSGMGTASATDDISTQSTGSGYAGYAAGITAVSSVVTDIAKTNAFKAELNAKTNTDIRNAGYIVDNYELSRAKNIENVKAINHALGDKLSERGLTAMKEAATMTAAKVESGTSGGSTDAVVQEAFMNRNFDEANIRASAKQQLRGVLSSMEMQENSVRNRVDSLLIGGGVAMDTNPLVSGIAGGLNVGTTVLGMIPMKERIKAFGITPDDYNA